MTGKATMIVSLALLASTAACGGGGGGGGSGPAPAASSGGAAQGAASTNFNNPSVVAATAANGNVGSSTMAADQTSQIATLSGDGTPENPGMITISVPGMGINHQFNTSVNQLPLDGTVTFNGAPIFSINGSNIAMFKDGAGGVLVNDNSGNLSFSNYGIWSHGDPDVGQKVTAVGAFATGGETLATDLPTTGTATYTGSAVATGTSGGTNVNWAGTFNGGVDFAARTATVGLNLAASDNTSGALNLASGPISMTGARYAGGIASTGTGLAVSGTTAGALYGPAANEMSGVFNVAGSGTTAIGAYGGAQAH